MSSNRNKLASKLIEIQYHDNRSEYDKRNVLVYEAVALAIHCGYEAGFRIDPKEPEWPAAFIEIPPFGQVSWHVPQHPHEWDKHTTEQKRLAIFDFVAHVVMEDKS